MLLGSRFWEACNEIHGYCTPAGNRDLRRLEKSIGCMTYRFDSCTGITIGQVSGNFFSHSWPPVVLADKFIGSSSFRVSSCGVVMMGMHDFLVQGFILMDIE